MQEKEFSLTKQQEAWVVDIMLSVTLVKLGLVVYCRSFTNEIIKAYAQDHFFDVVTNVIGLAAALLANYIANWIDPIGAIIVSRSGIILFYMLITFMCSSVIILLSCHTLPNSLMDVLNLVLPSLRCYEHSCRSNPLLGNIQFQEIFV